jgi:hypothetical protein
MGRDVADSREANKKVGNPQWANCSTGKRRG